MKKLILSITLLFLTIAVHAQIGNNFTAEIKALLEADVEKIKGPKDEKSVSTAYHSILPLTGFKVLLKESFGTYRVSCSYSSSVSAPILDSVAASSIIDSIGIKLSKLRYIFLDSKKNPKVLELNKGSINVYNPTRKILLLDIEENLRAEVLLSDGKYPTLLISIYKFNRKLFKQ